MNKKKSTLKLSIASVAIYVLSAFSFQQQKVDRLSLDLVAKTLYQGKSVTIKSEVYFKSSGSLMVTHFTSPMQKVAITNGNGEFKEYDVVNNTVTMMQGLDLSTKNSLFYSFLSGSINDMGLTASGFKMNSTKIENKMVISEWVPKQSEQAKISKVELVHENYLPIYLAFYNAKNEPIQKAFYSNYQQVGNIKMPFTITEFEFVSPVDSIITKRTYSNLKLNAEVSEQYLNFKIPADAKINLSTK